MRLFKLITDKKEFYVVASDPTDALMAFEDFLDNGDYAHDRFKVKNIGIIAEENKYINVNTDDTNLIIRLREKIE